LLHSYSGKGEQIPDPQADILINLSPPPCGAQPNCEMKWNAVVKCFTITTVTLSSFVNLAKVSTLADLKRIGAFWIQGEAHSEEA
jgi:hypothetical protein